MLNFNDPICKIKEFFGLSDLSDDNIVTCDWDHMPKKEGVYLCIMPMRGYNSYYTSDVICVVKITDIRRALFNNDKGPAFVSFNVKGHKLVVSYYKSGNKHRFAGPAELKYEHGMCVKETFYKKGNLHNAIGPAVRLYSGNRWHNLFYNENVRISMNMFLENLNRRLCYEL